MSSPHRKFIFILVRVFTWVEKKFSLTSERSLETKFLIEKEHTLSFCLLWANSFWHLFVEGFYIVGKSKFTQHQRLLCIDLNFDEYSIYQVNHLLYARALQRKFSRFFLTIFNERHTYAFISICLSSFNICKCTPLRTRREVLSRVSLKLSHFNRFEWESVESQRDSL